MMKHILKGALAVALNVIFIREDVLATDSDKIPYDYVNLNAEKFIKTPLYENIEYKGVNYTKIAHATSKVESQAQFEKGHLREINLASNNKLLDKTPSLEHSFSTYQYFAIKYPRSDVVHWIIFGRPRVDFSPNAW